MFTLPESQPAKLKKKKCILLPSRIVFTTAVRMKREECFKRNTRNLSKHYMHHQIIGKLKIEMQGIIHEIAKFYKKFMDGLICYS